VQLDALQPLKTYHTTHLKMQRPASSLLLLFALAVSSPFRPTAGFDPEESWAGDMATPPLRNLQSSNARVVAEAYLCDEFLRELPEEELKAFRTLEEDREVRVCVWPTRPTRNRGIVMRSIDQFAWFKQLGGVVQTAIRDKADVKGTISVCNPGEVICSFKTLLFEDFFYGSSNATVLGSGRASMQTSDFRRMLGDEVTETVYEAEIRWRDSSSMTGTERDLQRVTDTVLGGFAGDSGVDVTFVVDRREAPDNFIPTEGEDTSGWWSSAPGWLKALIIIAAIAIVLMGCCLCCMCCYALYEQRYGDKEKDKLEESPETSPPNIFVEPEEPSTARPSRYSYVGDAITNSPPTDKDVCFDADEHPGTKAMHVAVDKCVKKYPYDEYTPEQYRHIKKQLIGRRFFVCDNDDEPDMWREVTKVELVELLRLEFEKRQSERQASDIDGGTLDDEDGMTIDEEIIEDEFEPTSEPEPEPSSVTDIVLA